MYAKCIISKLYTKNKRFGSETRQLYPFEIFHDRGFHRFLLFVRVNRVKRSSMSPRYYGQSV
jgi:hypothetical protein